MRGRFNPARTTTTIMLAFVLVSMAGGAAAQEGGGNPDGNESGGPELDVEAWALVDQETGLFLDGENADEQLPIGSVNKIMTALVVLDEGVDLDEEVEISPQAEEYVGGVYSNVGLIAGERVSVRDLLAATMIPSGTEAAYALAEYAGDGSVEEFVEMMNDEATSMGLENTNFETPAGLDTTGNYSSARDLAEITQAALEYPLFAEIVDTTDTTISTQSRTIDIASTNQLLTTYPPTTGVKTGTTPEAGANLVASAESDDESYISVVIGAEDSEVRFLSSEEVLEYGFGNYDQEAVVEEGEVYDEMTLPYRRGATVELAAEEDINAPVDDESEIERRATTDEAPPEAAAGEELGEVEVFVNGQSAGRSPLVAVEGYEQASIWNQAWYGIQGAYYWTRDSIAGLFA